MEYAYRTVILPFFCLYLMLSAQNSTAQGWKWAREGTGGTAEAYLVATDLTGNVFGAGATEGFPLAFGNVTIPYSISPYTIFTPLVASFNFQTILVKYDRLGNVLWAEGIQKGPSEPISMTTDQEGNLILLGIFFSPQIRIGNIDVYNNLAQSGIPMYFLAKFDPSGNVMWAKNSGSASIYFSNPLFVSTGNPASVAVNNSGQIFITGSFETSQTIIGPISIANTNGAGGTSDIFIAKCDKNGNVLWAKHAGGAGNENVFGIAVSPAGHIFFTGVFESSSMSFGSLSISNPYSNPRGFIAEYDDGGDPIWCRAFGEQNGSVGIAVSCDPFGNVYLDGVFFDDSMSIGGVSISKKYSGDNLRSEIFLAQFSSVDTINWIKGIGCMTTSLTGYSVTTSQCGQVWIAGGLNNVSGDYYGYEININGQIEHPPDSSTDVALIAGFNTNGSPCGYSFLQSGGDDIVSVSCDQAGNIYLCGDARSLGYFNYFFVGPDTIFFKGPNDQNEYFFVAKFVNDKFTHDVIHISQDVTLCAGQTLILNTPLGSTGPYLWNNGSTNPTTSVSASGTYWVSVLNACVGADIVDTFHVILKYPEHYTSSIDTLICHKPIFELTVPIGFYSYIWSTGDTIYETSGYIPGTYWVTYQGLCSSYVDTFHVTTSDLNITFNLGRDSAVCKNILLKIPVDSATYIWQDGSTNQTYDATIPGTYYATVYKQGCYSYDTINLAIYNFMPIYLDTFICLNQPLSLNLSTNAPWDASIRWGTEIGSSSQTVTDTGIYFALVKDSICVAYDTFKINGGYCDCHCFVPNTFTPNHDGKNDGIKPLFKIGCEPSNYTFSIFDRWGTLVFTTHDPSARWDGNYQGVPYPIGTYMYETSYTGGLNNKKYFFKGDITLVR